MDRPDDDARLTPLPEGDTPRASPDGDALDPPAEQPIDVPEPAVACWRCDRVGPPVAGWCRWCRARLTENPAAREPTLSRPSPPLGTVLVVYALMLGTSIVWAWMLLAGGARMAEDDVILGTAVLEVVDTVLVAVALGLIGRRACAADPPAGRPLFAWVIAGPVLFVLVCLGVLYTAGLREVARPGGEPGWPTGLTAGAVLLICVQPAVVEELFFRYAAFGILARTTTAHAAVGVTAVMFAMAHIYNPLGLPYLFLCGVVFGYARVYGGLALPIVLHFLHNLAVVAIEGS
ncbi:MAG: amino terminal protease self-immunity [Gemmataceae bacterium]|nr:amino terminal protease self-immunity [Gemmataceae bacterium]